MEKAHEDTALEWEEQPVLAIEETPAIPGEY
jgi:hypothetical protein